MAHLNIGLLGCGNVAQAVHLDALLSLPNVKLAAVADTNPDHLARTKLRVPEIKCFENYYDLLQFPEIDAVVICLPNALHAEACVAALKANKHVYLEKPLATNLHEGRLIIEAWEKQKNVIGMIGFNFRFHKPNQKACQLLKTNILGKIIVVRSIFSTAIRNLSSWQRDRQSGGGVLLELASHHVDLVRFFFEEEIKEVFAETWSLKSEWDTATLEIKLKSGLMIQSFFSMNSINEDRFEIYGEGGKLTLDRYRDMNLNLQILDRSLKLMTLKRFADRVQSFIVSPISRRGIGFLGRKSYKIAIHKFVKAIQTKQPVKPDFWDGYRNLLVVEAAEKSATTKEITFLSQ